MPTNPPTGDGHRNGAVRKRSEVQVEVVRRKHFIKRDGATGEFVAQKKDGEKVKGVRREDKE